jgi:hypothetical protein
MFWGIEAPVLCIGQSQYLRNGAPHGKMAGGLRSNLLA